MNNKSYSILNKKIAIVGSGVVGQATGKGLIKKGFKVIFIDINKDTVEDLCRNGCNAVLSADVNHTDIGIFLVSVPSYTSDEEGGLYYLKEAARKLGTWLKSTTEYSLVVIRSTVVPGTTEEVIVPILEKYSGKKAWENFGICVNPEYLREKTAEDDFIKPWLVVIGEYQKKDGDILEQMYKWAKCPVSRISIKEAEIQKLVHNIYNANKISFFNEMRMLCKILGINADAVFPLVAKSAEGSWNPNYGIRDFGPFDGACLPKDTRAMSKFASENLEVDLKILNAIIEVNNNIRISKKV